MSLFDSQLFPQSEPQIVNPAQSGGGTVNRFEEISVGAGTQLWKVNKEGQFMGSETFATAPFRVNYAGAVTASNFNMTGGTISGTIISSLPAGSLIDIQGWMLSSTFSSLDVDTVQWSAGTITLGDGTTFSISAGNTGNMADSTTYYIYFDKAVSLTVLQTTTTPATAVGGNKILMAVAQKNMDSGATEATFQTFGGSGGAMNSAVNLAQKAVTAAKTSIASINPLDGEINANKIGTTQIDTNAVTEAKVLAGAITNAKLGAGAVTSSKAGIALRGWTQTCAFSVTDADTVSWGVGTFTASDGTAYSILAGNTGNMSAKTYIYLDIAVSTTAYQVTTTASTATGDGKVLIGIAQNNTTEAVFQLMNDNSSNIDASNIVAGSLTANEIAASTITGAKIAADTIVAGNIAAGAITASEIAAGAVTANKITSFNFMVLSGTFTSNDPATDKVSWTECKVVYNGTEYTVAAGNCETTDKHIYWQIATPTVFAKSPTLPVLGNEDFLVAFNDSGTALLVWNSTVINGNRITTGSINTTNLAAGSITANEIATGAITAGKIFAGAIATDDLAAGCITALKIAVGTITGDRIYANTIDSGQIKAGAIRATEIATGTITADRMNISTLSSISANIGTITAGTIYGCTIQSSNGNGRIVLDSGDKLYFYDGSGNIQGTVYGSADDLNIESTDDITMKNRGTARAQFGSSGLKALDSTYTIGISGYRFSKAYFNNYYAGTGDTEGKSGTTDYYVTSIYLDEDSSNRLKPATSYYKRRQLGFTNGILTTFGDENTRYGTDGWVT